MSFATYIENLRAKPEHERKRFAFWSSLCFTAIIAAFWLASFTGINIGAESAVSSAVAKAGTPAQSLVAGVGAFGGDVWTMLTGPKKISYAEIQVSPGKSH